MSNQDDTLKTLRAAVKGLLFMSESDRPLKAFVWDEKAEDADTPVDALTTAKGVDTSCVKTLPVAEFFQPMTRIEDWMGADEKATATNFSALVDMLGKTLTGAQALRVDGGTTIDAYVVGKDAAGRWAGVSTQLVET